MYHTGNLYPPCDWLLPLSWSVPSSLKKVLLLVPQCMTFHGVLLNFIPFLLLESSGSSNIPLGYFTQLMIPAKYLLQVFLLFLFLWLPPSCPAFPHSKPYFCVSVLMLDNPQKINWYFISILVSILSSIFPHRKKKK